MSIKLKNDPEYGLVSISLLTADQSIRKIDVETVKRIACSIELLGELLHPIAVDEDGVVIDGFHRLAAVKSLGWMEVPVRVVRRHLDVNERTMLQLMANSVRYRLSVREIRSLIGGE